MLKDTKKLNVNLKILRFFIFPIILFSTTFFYNTQNAKAGLEFQWDQDSGYRRLKWFQKENKRKFRNTIYHVSQTELIVWVLFYFKDAKIDIYVHTVESCSTK